MKKFNFILLFCFALFLFAGLNSCGGDDNGDGNGNEPVEFDRDTFLSAYANSLLKNRMADLTSANNNLHSAISTLVSTPNAENLAAARDNYLSAALQWQRTNFMNFGPGAKEGFRLTIFEELAIWPLDTELIEEKIMTQEFAIDDSNRETRGLLTIEYILYPDQSVESALLILDQSRLNYLLAISEKLKNQTEEFNEDWQGNYPADFIANNGTDVKSSTSSFYNEWLRSYEVLKNMKIIEPAGLKAGQDGPEPELVESNHAELSLDFARAHFDNIVEIYFGGPTDINSIGWDDYLKSVEGGEELVNMTITQIKSVQDAFDMIPSSPSLKELMEEEHPSIEVLRTEMQTLLPYFKSEMSSLLGLAITFSSSDGD
ncbi:MAG: imelysin family protein [Bacteroidota bacterium]